MESCTSPSASHRFKVLSPLPPSFRDIPEIMEGSDTESPLMEKKMPSARSTWSADAADLIILLCSFLLTTSSIVLVALIFHTQVNSWSTIPHETLSILQRVISTLSVGITSAVIMVAGKRYVLFKLARGGLRSRRVAVYSNPSIGNLATYLVLHGAELPLLGLSAVWGLALVTGLTVNDSWEMGSISNMRSIAVPFGPFDPATPGSSWFISASEQLTFVMSSLCIGVAGTVGLVNITSTNIATNHPMGTIYYPPLPYWNPDVGFSFSTTMNGFNISMEQLSSVPSTARNLTCVPSTIATLQLWSDGSDDQTLSIIVVDSPPMNNDDLIFRFNATAIIMDGILSSSGNYTEFAPNGTSWPNVMPTGNQWAQDITSLICNTSSPSVGICVGSSFSDFAGQLNDDFLGYYGSNEHYFYWSTALSMALGAYSSAMYPYIGDRVEVPCTLYGVQFTSDYGTYILVLNIVVSVIMLIIVVRLRMASHLGADFINSTRLLLDPLEKPELFNASLDTTVDALADPYMLVREDSAFLLVAQKSTRERRTRIETFALRRYNPFNRSLQLYHRRDVITDAEIPQDCTVDT